MSVVFFIQGCIPLKIAPRFEGARVYVGKKFKKNLPQQNVYVFEDPKNANEFYHYINAKYKLDYDVVGGNLPLVIGDKKYYLTFYEVERSTQTVNLVPIAVDVALAANGHDPYLADAEYSRAGSWYIALTVTDDDFKDNLKETYPSRELLLKHLDAMRQEYLSTANYTEVYLKY